MEILQQNPKLVIQMDGEQKYFCTGQSIYLVKNFKINHKERHIIHLHVFIYR